MKKPILTSHQQFEQRRFEAGRLFAQDLSNAEIARRLKVARQTVSGWRQRYDAAGEAGLKSSGPPGRTPRLTQAQWSQILQRLSEGPQAHGHKTLLWTLARIGDLIEEVTSVRYTSSHVWYLLKAHGWSAQKPARRSKSRDEAGIQGWKETDWPRIKKGPSSEGPR